MLDRKILKKVFILLILSVPMILASMEESTEIQENQQCKCLNGGTCSNTSKYMACNCPSGYIGDSCQSIATEISNIEKQAIIDQKYSYFYFQPKEINYYQVSLKICLPQNLRKNFTSMVFLEVQKSSGKLKLEPSIYQTSPITFKETQDRCQVFYTHFIPIRQKLNDQFQKIVFGISIKNNSDTAANRWVNFLQRSMTNPDESLRVNEISEEQLGENKFENQPQIESQKIFISCTYELYMVENNWGTLIVTMSAITLFVSTAVFFYSMRKNFASSMANEDMLRMYADNPEDYVSNQNIKHDLSHFRVIMPIMSYELVVQRSKRAQKNFPMNLLKRGIEANNEFEQSREHQIQKSEYSQSSSAMCNEQLIQSEGNGPRIENTCTICLINFQKAEKVRQTPCKHIFHQDCIDSWCENTLNCPVCRSSLEMAPVGNKKQLTNPIQN